MLFDSYTAHYHVTCIAAYSLVLAFIGASCIATIILIYCAGIVCRAFIDTRKYTSLELILLLVNFCGLLNVIKTQWTTTQV